MAVTVRSRGVRVLRGLLVASLSVAVAAFSHVAGGGVAPGVLGTTLALTFAVLVCIALGSKALSPVRLSISVVLSQVVFHLLFSLGSSLPKGASGHSSTGMLGMAMSGGHTALLPHFVAAGVVSTEVMSDARMWLGHGVAAAITIALVLRGESAFLGLIRLGGARLARVVRVVDGLPATSGVTRHGVDAALDDVSGIRPLGVLLVSRPHRGPPVAA